MADEARNLKQYKELPDNSTLLLVHLTAKPLRMKQDLQNIISGVNENACLQSVSTKQIHLLMRRVSTMSTLTLRTSQVRLAVQAALIVSCCHPQSLCLVAEI